VTIAAAALAGPAAAKHDAGAPTVFPDCLGKPLVKPADLVIACGDGNESLSNLTWVGWGSPFTAGRGVVTINDCTPSCAAGHDHDYPVVVILTGRQTCRPSGKIAYARLSLAFLDNKAHQSASVTFPCRAR
jgi:hypothetical protein